MVIGNLWQCCRDEPGLDNNSKIIDYLANSNNNISFKLNKK